MIKQGKTQIILILLFLALLPKALATFGPRAFVTEYVLAHYNSNGSINTTEIFPPCQTTPCKYGIVEMSIPNKEDVLQQVRINLSSTANTNLQAVTAYKNFVTSYPTSNTKQNISVNTTQAAPADYYNITNNNVAPTINLSISVKNFNGGNDIFDDDNIITNNNTLNFTLNASNSGTVDLNNSRITVQFRKNTVGASDVINVSNPVCAVGSCSREDSDSDGYYDRIVWDVNLTQSSSTILEFNGTITSGVNFPDTDKSVNLDSNDKGVTANHSKNSTYTEITILRKFVRGPVRQGIDLVQNSTTGRWLARGYLTNAANSTVDAGESTLTYNISSWRLYTINQTTGEPLENVQNGTFALNTFLNASKTIYTTDSRSSNTSWHDTGSTTKPFYGSYFEWEVVWNSTYSNNYLAFTNTTLDLPTLYKIDMVNDKTSAGAIISGTNDSVVTITDTSRHNGHANVPAKFIQILSVVPVNTTANEFHGKFRINSTSLKFYFDNSTLGGSSYELLNDTYATVLTTDPAADGSSNGLVNLTITNLSQASFATGGAVGHYLNPNEKIKLVFEVISNESMVAGDDYNFTGNSTQKTASDTPITENHPSITVSVSVVSITLIVNTVNFGTLYPTNTSNTTANNPPPFVIQNDGSVDVNITTEATNLWSAISNPSIYYQFQSALNETNSVPDPNTDLVTVWTNIPLTASPVKFATRLNSSNENDELKGHINITVPSDEPAGDRTSTVTFTASQA